MRYRAPIQSLELEVDLRSIPPEQRTDDLMGMFSGLGRGEGLVFIDDQPPVAALQALQDRFAGCFDWYPLTTETAARHVLLVRRVARLSPLRRVVDFMTSDHRRLELMLMRTRELAEAGEWRRAGRVAGFLQTGAERHIEMEEQVLFPVLLTNGAGSSYLPELQQEHRRLLFTLGRLEAIADEAELSWPVPGSIEREVVRLTGELLRSFFRHEEREDRLLYARTDLLVGRDETEQIVRRCQAI